MIFQMDFGPGLHSIDKEGYAFYQAGYLVNITPECGYEAGDVLRIDERTVQKILMWNNTLTAGYNATDEVLIVSKNNQDLWLTANFKNWKVLMELNNG